MTFSYSLDFQSIDFRTHPELYRIGKGEQGVLLVEPYKSEILPHWRFKTPEIARESAAAITALFERYRAAGDFVGMDMARKFLQMGYTRSRRYANRKSGRKYADGGAQTLPFDPDPVKAKSADIFKAAWTAATQDPEYRRLMAQHKERYESVPATSQRSG